MKLPYESTTRRTLLSITGYSLPLPCFFPSISSIKTNLLPSEYLRVLVVMSHPQFLLSAFDVFHCAQEQRDEINILLEKAHDAGQIILLDSGNYESYWKDDYSWNPDDFKTVLQTTPCHLAFSFDRQDQNSESEQIASAIEISVLSAQDESSRATVVPIIHAPIETMVTVVGLVTEKLCPVMLAVPERELGDGIITRAANLLRIRNYLDETSVYYPIHLLGTGNPLSMLIYYMCGADSFDGLEWCQTTVDHQSALLYHFHQREFFGEQTPFCSMKELPYHYATLAHNLLFYRLWMKRMSDALKHGDFADLAKQYLPHFFLENLNSRLREVA